MKRGAVELVNRLGLHARAAAKLVHLARTFSSQVRLVRSRAPSPDANGAAPQAQPHGATEEAGLVADGKSIMSVLLLAAPLGSRLELTVEGEDEAEAFAAIVQLIGERFGEEE